MRSLPYLLPLLLALAPLAQAADQAEKAPAAEEHTTLFGQLGAPARPRVVRELAEAYRSKDAAAQMRLANALGMAGGPAAILGLVKLAERGDAVVRKAAFEAALRVGLRHPKLRGVVRWALGRRHAPDRAAAVAALGVAGDGRDIADLLRLAESEKESPQVRLAAFGALRRISGEAKPYRIERWKIWWAAVGRQGPARVTTAIKTFEEDPEMRQVAAGVLARLAWLRLERVSERVAVWLRAEDDVVRMAAARIAASSASADLAAPLAEAWAQAKEGSRFRAAAAGALARLGAKAFLGPDAPEKSSEATEQR